jgi:hypothetical protein
LSLSPAVNVTNVAQATGLQGIFSLSTQAVDKSVHGAPRALRDAVFIGLVNALAKKVPILHFH